MAKWETGEINISELTKKIESVYKRAEAEVKESWDAYCDEISETIKGHLQAYDEAVKSGDKEAIEKKLKKLQQAAKDKTINDQRYQALTVEIATQYELAAETAAKYINDELASVYSENFKLTAEKAVELSARLGVDLDISGIAFAIADSSTAKNLIMNDETLLPYLKIDGKKYERWTTQKINAEVLQGIIQGEAIPKIAKRLQNVTEMTEKTAVRNARTAATSAQAKGRYDSMQELTKKGVVWEKEWLSAHDARTRDAHAELNGKRIKLDESFENSFGEIRYPGDPEAHPANVYNCRCTLLSRYVGVVDDNGKKITYKAKRGD